MPHDRPRIGFTLIELLVVITIIVALLAMLAPAMDKAIEQAQRVSCLAGQHNIVSACQFYALDNRRTFPVAYYGTFDWGAPLLGGRPYAFSVDLRNTAMQPDPKVPLNLGLLAAGDFLPQTQLGRVIHCPSNDTSSAGPGINNYGMDQRCPDQNAAGGSWWTDPQFRSVRIVSSYTYRATSYMVTKNHSPIRSNRVGGAFVLISDTPDPRFGIGFTHQDGYNRSFADGAGGFFRDPERIIDNYVRARPPGFTDGLSFPFHDEEIYQYMARGDQAQAPIPEP